MACWIKGYRKHCEKDSFDIPLLSVLPVNLAGVVDFVVFALTFRLSDAASQGNVIKHGPCIGTNIHKHWSLEKKTTLKAIKDGAEITCEQL